MSTGTLVPEQEYLTTPYEYPPEYVDGVLEERPMPTWSHADVQMALGIWFAHHHPELRALPELRYHVRATTYRLPDLVLVPRNMAPEQTLRTAPHIAIEILIPDDRMTLVLAKLKEYAEAGVPAIWLLDPETASGYIFTLDQGLRPVKQLTAEHGAVTLDVGTFFAGLTR